MMRKRVRIMKTMQRRRIKKRRNNKKRRDDDERRKRERKALLFHSSCCCCLIIQIALSPNTHSASAPVSCFLSFLLSSPRNCSCLHESQRVTPLNAQPWARNVKNSFKLLPLFCWRDRNCATQTSFSSLFWLLPSPLVLTWIARRWHRQVRNHGHSMWRIHSNFLFFVTPPFHLELPWRPIFHSERELTLGLTFDEEDVQIWE